MTGYPLLRRATWFTLALALTDLALTIWGGRA